MKVKGWVSEREREGGGGHASSKNYELFGLPKLWINWQPQISYIVEKLTQFLNNAHLKICNKVLKGRGVPIFPSLNTPAWQYS